MTSRAKYAAVNPAQASPPAGVAPSCEPSHVISYNEPTGIYHSEGRGAWPCAPTKLRALRRPCKELAGTPHWENPVRKRPVTGYPGNTLKGKERQIEVRLRFASTVLVRFDRRARLITDRRRSERPITGYPGNILKTRGRPGAMGIGFALKCSLRPSDGGCRTDSSMGEEKCPMTEYPENILKTKEEKGVSWCLRHRLPFPLRPCKLPVIDPHPVRIPT